jgi:hypothetical protein
MKSNIPAVGAGSRWMLILTMCQCPKIGTRGNMNIRSVKPVLITNSGRPGGGGMGSTTGIVDHEAYNLWHDWKFYLTGIRPLIRLALNLCGARMYHLYRVKLK